MFTKVFQGRDKQLLEYAAKLIKMKTPNWSSLSNSQVTGDADKSPGCEMMHTKHIYSRFKEKKKGENEVS